jgi:hypothetical protein
MKLGGDHERRELLGRERPQRPGVRIGAVGANDERDEPLHACRALADGRHGHANLGVALEPRLDLSELDAVAAKLYEAVTAPEVLDLAVLPQPSPVAGAVDPCASGPIRVGHEPLGGQPRAVEVPAGDAGAAYAQLALDADRDRRAMLVENSGGDVRERPTDRQALGGCAVFGEGRGDRGLRRAVQVEKAPAGRPTLDDAARAGLASRRDRAQVRKACTGSVSAGRVSGGGRFCP